MTLERAQQYQARYLADCGVESVMVAYRRQLPLERLN